jgi:hypothetical protein
VSKNLEKVDSHIQMPESILKNFVNEYQAFYCYDIGETDERFKIKRSRPKSLNVQNGHYSRRVEQMLQKAVESPLGRIIQYVKNNDFDNPIDIPSDFRDVVLTYIHSLIARAPQMYGIIEQHSVFLQIINNLDETDKNDFAVEMVLGEAKTNNPFQDYIVTMLVNKTEVPFLLPIGGMYSYGDFVCAPISLYRAIALVKQDSNLCNELIDGELCKVLMVEKESVLHQMNRFAIQAEVSHNKQYVVSRDKALIETYLKEMSLIR